MKLVVNTKQALTLLVSNKEKHIAEYELQMTAWQKAYADHTDLLKEWSQAQGTDGSETRPPAQPTKPQYYVKDYDKLINKLSVHVGDTIELGDSYGNEYEEIFENKFGWSQNFGLLSGEYVTSGYINSKELKSLK